MGYWLFNYLLVGCVQPDDYFSAKIQSLCPAISGNVCCTETQFDTLRAQVQQVRPTLPLSRLLHYRMLFFYGFSFLFYSFFKDWSSLVQSIGQAFFFCLLHGICLGEWCGMHNAIYLQAIPLLVGCPACLRNFLNLFCELSCSPNQSLFINVTSISEVSTTLLICYNLIFRFIKAPYTRSPPPPFFFFFRIKF